MARPSNNSKIKNKMILFVIVDLLVGGMYCYNIFLSFPFQSTIFQSIHFSSQTKQTFLF
eukprot:UN02878